MTFVGTKRRPKKKVQITTEKEAEAFLKGWLTQKLRRLSYQWPARKEALRAARVERGKYRCSMCEGAGVDKLYGPKEIVMDHVDPVISVEDGFIDWNTYLKRLFCPENGWQVLCSACHDIKTYLENDIRRQVTAEKEKDEDL